MDANEQFLKDVLNGLSDKPKHLDSKYFYNDNGDRLFQEICNLPEYYLTRAERNIFEHQWEDILNIFSDNGLSFNLIELGSGDGSKTRELIGNFLKKQKNFVYTPIDISPDILHQLELAFKEDFPRLKIDCAPGDYFVALHALNNSICDKKVILFLGSTIGNYNYDDAVLFLKSIHKELNPGDMILTGFDLKKDPYVILQAYNDKHGITRKFNLNLLHRINSELHADIDVDAFYHYPTYNPASGEAKSYLISERDQSVTIHGKTVFFARHESVFMEVSRKFSLEEIESMARDSGFKVVTHLFDENQYFTDSIWKV